MVRDHRMQPFGPEIVAIVGRQERTTAAQSLTFLAASVKVKFQGRPVVR